MNVGCDHEWELDVVEETHINYNSVEVENGVVMIDIGSREDKDTNITSEIVKCTLCRYVLDLGKFDLDYW